MKTLLPFIMLLVMTTSPVLAGEEGPLPLTNRSARESAERLRDDLLKGRVGQRTNAALDAIISVSVQQLRASGYEQEAVRLQEEWESKWFGYVMRLRDLGDHAPLSLWLADVYNRLENLLGEQLMSWLHLDDIKIINYAIPVVFRPCNEEWDSAEYKLHFVPLSGVLAYWGAVIPCWVATSGIASFLCSPLGMLSEHVMTRFLAPGISDRAYRVACGEE